MYFDHSMDGNETDSDSLSSQSSETESESSQYSETESVFESTAIYNSSSYPVAENFFVKTAKYTAQCKLCKVRLDLERVNKIAGN
jgi:hypothetical protein